MYNKAILCKYEENKVYCRAMCKAYMGEIELEVDLLGNKRKTELTIELCVNRRIMDV